ncbi:MAG TPA: 16S rRNA (guanine(527)-N(7))-methyltransferase RsmG [Bacillota bacterium]|nr:16S rRNA (guanine(527)-N(7))-methyltransferase RsmG [Bacillota bacterium]
MTYEELRHALSQEGVPLSEEQLKSLELYISLLAAATRRMNLTAIEDEAEMVRKHLLDSLLVVPHLPSRGSLLDVGSGAGLPGIPLAVAVPGLRVTLLDSITKKVGFLKEAISGMSLGDRVKALSERAEKAGHFADMRESYDVVISRAVARLNVLSEYCLPFVRVGGRFLAMKGPAGEQEAAEAEEAIALLGGRIAGVHLWQLPGGGEQRSLVIIQKCKNTPIGYPRRDGLPAKNPL